MYFSFKYLLISGLTQQRQSRKNMCFTTTLTEKRRPAGLGLGGGAMVAHAPFPPQKKEREQKQEYTHYFYIVFDPPAVPASCCKS